MSVSKDIYVIIGYDLTEIKDKILTEDFKESEEYEKLSCFQRAGNIQIFDDPMCGNCCYYGCIISVFGEYEDDIMCEVGVSEITIAGEAVIANIREDLPEAVAFADDREPKVIVFAEYR